MYPVAINNRVKLACASYLISMSKTDTLTFVYKDYRISFFLNYFKKRNVKKQKTLESMSIRFRYRLILLDKDLHNMIVHLIYITKRYSLFEKLIIE